MMAELLHPPSDLCPSLESNLEVVVPGIWVLLHEVHEVFFAQAESYHQLVLFIVSSSVSYLRF